MDDAVTYSENPPALAAAADVLGEQLRAHLERLAQILKGQAASLERKFLMHLRRAGYEAVQRRALAAITPGAASRLLAAGKPVADFFEQVEYNGRRLAKLNLAPDRIITALGEYDRLLAPLFRPLPAPERANLGWAREQLQFCVVLTLNNAFYQVREAETSAYQELFRAELESKTMDELLPRMIETLTRFCRARAGALFLRDWGSGDWILRAAVEGTDKLEVRSLRVTGTRLRSGKLSVPACRCGRVEGLVLDPAWRGRYRSCWSVPLAAGDCVAGVMQFGFAGPYEWLPREQDLLAAAGERCLLAAEKARLVEDLAAREEQVRALGATVVATEERERRRISAELHDEAGQSLLCIRLQLELLERLIPESLEYLKTGLAETRALTERTISEIRRLISALSPAVLEQLGLPAALRQIATRLRRFHGMEVRVRTANLVELPDCVAAVAYRLIQECANNIARHSSASSVNISAVHADGRLRLRVADDGVGFRVEEKSGKSESHGLAGMRERVTLCRGEFQIQSRPRKGTQVLIELPVTPEIDRNGPKIPDCPGRNRA